MSGKISSLLKSWILETSSSRYWSWRATLTWTPPQRGFVPNYWAQTSTWSTWEATLETLIYTSRPSSAHSRPEGTPWKTCWLTCPRVMQHAWIRPLWHICCENRRTMRTENIPFQNILWRRGAITSRIRNKIKSGTFHPNSKKRSLPFRPNSRPSIDLHTRRETVLSKRVPTDLKGLPRRKPLRGRQRPSEMVLRRTKSRQPL